MTWDDLYELTKRVTRTVDGQKYRGLTFAFQHMMFLNQLSAPHLDPKTYKPLFTEDNFVRAFENMARFYRIPGNELPNNKFALSNQQDPFYKDKTVAMILTLSGTGKTFGTNVNWDVVQVPFFKDKPDIGPQSYPNYFYITNMSKNRDAAFQVLAYVTSEEFQEWQIRTGTPSILKDQSKIIANFGADEPVYQGKNIKSLLPAKFAAPTMKTQFQSIADTEILAALGDYAAGKDVNTALREAAERAEKKINAELGK
jgi:multiple sugar transport system substrate-binding protein